jgi:16S rRNA (guanine527-N7)-methyltransferase
MSLEEQLNRGLAELTLKLSPDSRNRLIQYVDLLAKWNRVYNLTAVRDPTLMVTRHILDSLAVVPHLHGTRILDVGTGPGLPGIPLALACPEREFVLLDSNGKKTRFLTQVVAELGLINTSVTRARVEQFRPTRTFDTVVSRAFSSLTNLAEAAGPLCAADGRIVAMKGVYPVAEMEELPRGYEVVEVAKIHVPGLDAERHLVIMKHSENG